MNIEFLPGSKEVYQNVQEPVSSKTTIPKWYKDIFPSENLNVKNCMPFLDSLSSGYIQLAWDDIYVEKKKDIVDVYTNGDISLVSLREKSDIFISDNFHKLEFIWVRHWAIKLPEGYSALITHPLNRYDLPFVTMSGIVDSDDYSHARVGSYPFYLNKDFEGIIPKGTPLFQIIPFKRENWSSIKQEYNDNLWIEKEKIRESVNVGMYKKMFWKKKKFD